MRCDLTNQQSSEDGYELWLRYVPIADASVRGAYQTTLKQILRSPSSPTLDIAQEELTMGLERLLGTSLPLTNQVNQPGTLVFGTPQLSPLIAKLHLDQELDQVGDEGFVIRSTTFQGKACIVIAANTEIGVFYGVFHFLRHVQTHKPLHGLHIVSTPKIKLRMLNHWDNLSHWPNEISEVQWTA